MNEQQEQKVEEESSKEPSQEEEEQPLDEQQQDNESSKEPSQEGIEKEVIKFKPKSSSKTIEERNVNKDITNMSLNNPNPISKRLDEYDSKLFKIDVSKEYKAYSRICPSNVRRQPVILTDDEKEYIDKYHKGSYEEAIKYGSDPNKQHWFICPRYWSLKDNVSLTQQQVDSGKYGKIIPKDAKKVPPGGNIYEFTDDKYHTDKSGKYVTHYPGFVKEDSKHPHNLCIPCCFKNWNTPAQESRRNHCLIDEKKIKITKKTNKQVDDYIKGPDKFPLDEGRWGILPLSIQKLLQFDNKECFNGNNIKSNEKCLLRNGIEYSIKHSFIGCIANLYSEYNNNKIEKISNMKNIIIYAIDIDTFIKLNNGNLISIFQPKQINDNIDIKVYEKSNLYNRLDYSNKNNLKLFKKIVNSYENFLKFLGSDEVIDYKYLWDVISYPNSKLFKDGLNLLIIDIDSDDVTNDIKILCPDTLFSNNFYDNNKNVFIILKKNNFYEPLYIYSNNQIKLTITKLFNLSNKSILPKLKLVIEKILSQQNKLCLGKNSNKYYEFDKNIDINKLLNLIASKYEIIYVIQNFNNKNIGLVININGKNQYIPCYPSIIEDTDTDFIYKTSEELYEINSLNNYNDTIKFLNEIYEMNNSIIVKPTIKVIEDEQVIGILTNSNQFVPLIGPENNIDDELKKITDKDYILADNKIQTSDKLDIDRLKTINNIKIETVFFNLFRNLVKINLSKNENYKYRNDIVDILENRGANYLYNEKLEKINELLKIMLQNIIEFKDYKQDNDFIEKIEKNIVNTVNCNNNICNELYCKKLDNDCITIFPKINLINDNDNESSYYYKIADELLRYKLIKNYILKPNKFMYFNNLSYSIKDDEQLLLQSSLTQDFFENLISININSFANFNVYEDTSEFKIKSIKTFTEINYNNLTNELSDKPNIKKNDKQIEEQPEEQPEEQIEEQPKEQPEEQPEEQCKLNLKKLVGKWKPIFNDKTQELFYFIIKNNEICTFEILRLVFDNYFNKSHRKHDIKTNLIKSYNALINDFNVNEEKILEILKMEKKGNIINELKDEKISFELLINNENYFLSNLDLLVLIFINKIPIIILSTLALSETKNYFIILNKSENKEYYFCKIIETESLLNKYRLMINNGEILFKNSDLLESFVKNIENEKVFDLIYYINNFKSKGKKPKFKLIE